MQNVAISSDKEKKSGYKKNFFYISLSSDVLFFFLLNFRLFFCHKIIDIVDCKSLKSNGHWWGEEKENEYAIVCKIFLLTFILVLSIYLFIFVAQISDTINRRLQKQVACQIDSSNDEKSRESEFKFSKQIGDDFNGF